MQRTQTSPHRTDGPPAATIQANEYSTAQHSKATNVRTDRRTQDMINKKTKRLNKNIENAAGNTLHV